MTVDKDLKRLVRARAARTGESYAAARRSMTAASAVPEVVQDLWFTRATQGYSGRGAKPTGFEHHRVHVTGLGIVAASEVAFANFGVHRYVVRSDGIQGAARFECPDRGIVIEGRRDGRVWRAAVQDEGGAVEVELEAPAPPLVPSIAARFLPLVEGEPSYAPVPEDAHPAWRPSGRGSWFPVMGVAGDPSIQVRRIVDRGLEPQPKVKGKPEWHRYDHVDAAAVVRSTTWLDDAGRVVRYEQPGCVLRAVTAEEALRFDPGS